MAVHAHPDDESSKGSATTAKYVAEGHRVMVVSCTGGERGDILNEKLKGDPEVERDIVAYRRREMKAAQEILGCEHTWLGFVDSGLPEGDPLPPLPEGCFALEDLEAPTEALVRVIREFRPHVMTTYDEKGGYPHPDHIMSHRVAMAAFAAAGDPSRFPDAGPAWQPLKVYYNSGHRLERLTALHDAMLAEGLESPYTDWLANWQPRRNGRITTQVECADYFETRDRALLAHATQVDPDGFWFRVPMHIQRQVWPHEDFEAAVSYVPIREVETDLFAGLGTPEEADALATSGTATIVYDGRLPDGPEHPEHAEHADNDGPKHNDPDNNDPDNTEEKA